MLILLNKFKGNLASRSKTALKYRFSVSLNVLINLFWEHLLKPKPRSHNVLNEYLSFNISSNVVTFVWY